MANIALRKGTEPAIASKQPSSFLPFTWGRLEPFRWMEDFFRLDPFREMAPNLTTTAQMFAPDFEIEELADRYVFRGDLPGVAVADVDISVTGNRLTISGKRDTEQKTDNPNYYCCERAYGSFSRSFTLPSGADLEHVQADLKNGVLIIEVPKTTESQPRKIELSTGQVQGSKAARA
jgi:HSP20 family protein